MDDESTYRVLPGPDGGPRRFLDRETYEPVLVAESDHDTPVADLHPGYLVDAELDWSTAEPTVRTLSVRRPTLYAFAEDIDPVYEVAAELWEETRAAGDAMNARATKNTDNEVNGVCYVFADPGEHGPFDEFRDGARPLEPLVDRVNDSGEPAARELFVLRPADGEFTVVTIALKKDGRFADTLRDTYDCDRPDEPLA